MVYWGFILRDLLLWDLENRKYYKFDISDLIKFVNYIEEGNIFRIYGGVLLWICELIYVKE